MFRDFSVQYVFSEYKSIDIFNTLVVVEGTLYLHLLRNMCYFFMGSDASKNVSCL